jgi:hypothetical protein
VQCLYCETELKPLRGLFDEDFCCREHREKYLASFRKGISLLPVLNLPPITLVKQTVSEPSEVFAAEEPMEWAPPEAIAEEATEAPAVLRALDERALPESETPVESVEQLPLPASVPEPVLAVAEESQKTEPVCEIPAQVQQIEPVEVPLLATADKRPAATASVEASFEDTDYDAASLTPPEADFLYLEVAPFGASDGYFMIAENSFPACSGPAIPDVEVFCDAAFDPEERMASLLDPAEFVAAGAVVSQTRRGAATEPMAQVQAGLTRPSFGTWSEATSPQPALEVAEVIEEAEMVVAGHVSLALARSAAGPPMALPRGPLELLTFHASAGDRAHPEVAEPMPLALLCQEIESAPLVFSDMGPATHIHTPIFQVSAVAMQLDEDLKRAIEPPQTEAVRMAEPEIARPASMSAAPVSRAVTAASFQPATVSAFTRQEAQLNVPAMSSRTEVEPRLASEVVPDIAPGAGSDQPPAAHASEPVPPSIENSASIKKWRLKITFAKPA